MTQDSTHVQYRLQNPASGDYKITVSTASPYPIITVLSEPATTQNSEEVTSESTPYRLMVSARSLTNAMPIPDSIQPIYTVEDDIPIRIFVGDDMLPVLDADVTAIVTSPSGVVQEISLADDGLHSDSGASDGLYGGTFVPEKDGPYTVVILISGVNNNGETFTRNESDVVIVYPTSTAPSVCVLGENSVDLRDPDFRPLRSIKCLI